MFETFLARAPRLAVYVAVLWPAVAYGGYRGWPLTVTQVVALLGVSLWMVRALAARRLEWRRTALDLPLALLFAVVLVQIAIGNRRLVSWALAPTGSPDIGERLPVPFFAIGSIAPAQTAESLLLFVTYAAVYVLVTQAVWHRDELSRLVRTLLMAGGILAFLGLADYLAGGGWLAEDRGLRQRLSGSFVNPDHFGTWLGMLICLGIGYLAARRRGHGGGRSVTDVLTSSRAREDLIRRYLPLAAIAVMTVAVFFTFSRGALIALAASVAGTVLLFGRLGLARWSLALVGALFVLVSGYTTIVGLSPLLARLPQADTAQARWIQAMTSIPMLGEFPILGVGLGGYKDIYLRYQPTALEPGEVYFPYAHNDVLQLGLELGIVGLALAGFAAWRVGHDLLAVHLLGRGRCPVGGGEGNWSRRSDPFSIGLATGTLAALAVLAVHALFDFSARIPANGLLAAACLGIATVTLHTRFGADHRLLTKVLVLPVENIGRRLLVGLAATAVLLVPATLAARSALLAGTLDSLQKSGSVEWVSRKISWWLEDRSLLTTRSRAALYAATRSWRFGVDTNGQRLSSSEERSRVARAFVDIAVADARRALASTPTNAFLHERLAKAHALAAAIEGRDAQQHLAVAITHIQRAIVLAPDVTMFYETLATLALARPGPAVPIALYAAREAVSRNPALLERLLQQFLPKNLADAEWVAIVPETAANRLHLATLLERHGAIRDALPIYRQAITAATADEQGAARWMLANMLISQQDSQAAETELRSALRHEPDNPELYRTLGDALVQRRDPAALDHYRTALMLAEQLEQRGFRDTSPFAASSVLLRTVLADQVDKSDGFGTLRYRRAVAQYLTERKLWTAALEQWRSILRQRPDDGSAQFSAGLTLEAVGDRNAAVEAYRAAVSLGKNGVRYQLRFAQALWETEQYHQAMLVWQAIARSDPQDIEANLALARALTRAGDRAEAARHYRRVLERAPHHAEAQAEFAKLGVR